MIKTIRSGATQMGEDVFLQLLTDLIETSGVLTLDNDNLLVEAQGTPDTTILVNDGRAYIKKSNGNTYPVIIDTSGIGTSLQVSENSSGLNRKDAVVLYIDMAASPNPQGTNIGQLVIVAGTPNASPVVPTDGDIQSAVGASNPFIRLANFDANNGFTSIVGGDITDQRALLTLQIPSGMHVTERTAPDTPASGQVAIYAKDDGILYIKDDTGTESALVTASVDTKVSLFNQALINGAFDIWQRGTSITPNDDVYTADRWNLLTEANGAWTIARDTYVPVGLGFLYSAKLTNITLNNQVALVQVIENIEALKLGNGKASLSFYAKTNGTEIGTLRAAILSWDGTADVVTSDVIATWAQDGTDPTFAANWTKENTPSDLDLTSDWQRFTIENVDIDTALMTNIAVVIWVDDGTIAANDDFWITGIQLNQGETVQSWSPRTFDEELYLCRRFYETSWFPMTSQTNSDSCVTSSTNGYVIIKPKVTKRANLTTSNTKYYNGTTLNQLRNSNTGGTLSTTPDGAAHAANVNSIGIYDLGAYPAAPAAFDYNWIVDIEL